MSPEHTVDVSRKPRGVKENPPDLPPQAVAFLDRLSKLSRGEWARVNVRSKQTKVYAKALGDVDLQNRWNPAKKAAWEAARERAKEITLRNAPLFSRFLQSQLADAAADAVGVLIQHPGNDASRERLYGAFSDVIPGRSLEPRPPTPTSPATLELGAEARTQVALAPASGARVTKVDHGRGSGFLGDERLNGFLIWASVGLVALAFGGLATLTGIWEFWIIAAIVVLLPRSWQVIVEGYPYPRKRK